MSRIDDVYKPALSGKNVPILPLDNKWYKMMSGLEKTDNMVRIENEIKELLKTQGRFNSQIKEYKKLKKKLMNDIVGSMDDENASVRQDDIKSQIDECNKKIDELQEELMDLPKEIDELNYELMLETMDICYEVIADNTEKIEEISSWIASVRIELKKNIVRKQEREYKNYELYSYMHDIFGPSVIDIFDLKYNPENEHNLKPKSDKKQDNKVDEKPAENSK